MEHMVQTVKERPGKHSIIKPMWDSIAAGGESSDNDHSGEVFVNINDIEFKRQLGQNADHHFSKTI